MRFLLVSSTALVLVSAPFLTVSSASAEAPSLSISGQVDLAASLADTDTTGAGDGPDGVGLGVGNDQTQIIFDWTGRADNGLTYGARLDYRFQSANTDEQYIFLSGSWGRLVLGGDDGVIEHGVPGGDAVMVGEGGWDGNNVAHPAAGNAEPSADIDTNTFDDPKVTFYSPSFSGVSFGLTYIPDTNNTPATTGSAVNNSTVNGGATTDNPQFEGRLVYGGGIDGVRVDLGIGYAFQDGPDGFEDRTGMEVGGVLSFEGFSVGIGYGDSFETGCALNASCSAYQFATVGVAYAEGPFGISVALLDGENGLDGSDDSVAAGSIDAEYRIADGLLGYGGVQWVETTDASAGTEAETVQTLLGLRIGF